MPTESYAHAPPTLLTLGQLRLEPPDPDRAAPARKDLILLAFLARRSPSFVSRAELAAFMWGERTEERARQSLRQSLSVLRRSLGPIIEEAGDGVRVVPGTLLLDAAVFEQEVAARRIDAAVALWRGDFLAGADLAGGEVFREWLDGERARLHRLLAAVMQEWTAAAERSGDWEMMAGRARRWADLSPLDLAPRAGWIRALLAAGRLPEAAARFAEFDQVVERGGTADPREKEEWARLREAVRTPDRASLTAGPAGGTEAPPGDRPPARVGAAEELHAAWRRALQGGSGLVLISGGDGGERSRLLADFARGLSRGPEEAFVLAASDSDPGAAGTERWAAARRILARLPGAPGLGGASDASLAALAEILPALRERFPNLPAPDPRGPDAAAALADALGCVAAEVPVAVVCERLDGATAGLLRELAARPPGGVLLLVSAGTGRGADARVREAWLACPGAVRIDLDAHRPDARRRRARPRGRLLAAAAAIVLLAAVALSIPRSAAVPGEALPVVAIGDIRDLTGGDGSLAEMLPDLLATSLARGNELHVVSSARMYELLARTSGSAAGGARLAAARSAGAGELVEGALYRRPNGMLRLDLQRVRLSDGGVAGSYTVFAPDAFQLVDEAAAQILGDVRARGPLDGPGVPSTRSVVAFRFYGEGLRAFYRGDSAAAARLFEAALEEDSTFAMAGYYLVLAERSRPEHYRAALERAGRLARHASDPERLLIGAMRADFLNEPARTAIAETLAVRYPLMPDGQYHLGRAKMGSGDFLGAIPHLHRIIRMDSAGAREGQPRCRSCEAFGELVNAYLLVDSAGAAEREARLWLDWMPGSSPAIDLLANSLDAQGRYAEALAARRTAALQPAGTTLQLWEAIYAIRTADFPRADRLLLAQAESGSREERATALWYLNISLRYQGRYRDALRVAERYRAMHTDERDRGVPYAALLQAIVLFESGQTARAAALFDSLAGHSPQQGQAWSARHTTWMLTHAATAHAAGGDTAAVRRLIPRVREHGSRSSYGRDRLLHHHLRGLLLQARGDHRGAEAAFRAAIFSPTQGYTRTNLELARTLLHLERPAEAAELLRSALRGPLQASNMYATHAEIHELLARAAEAVGERDAAIDHYRWVDRAWTRADTPLRPRHDRARARLSALADGRTAAAPPAPADAFATLLAPDGARGPRDALLLNDGGGLEQRSCSPFTASCR